MEPDEPELQEEQPDENGVPDEVPDVPQSLHERMAVIEREWREMRVEWLSMYDQFRSLYGRISRRQQREEKGAREDPNNQPINPAAKALLGRM